MAEFLEGNIPLEKDEPYTSRRQRALTKVIPFKESTYEYDDRFIPASGIDDCHTIEELVRFSEKEKNVEIEAKVLCQTETGHKHKKFNKENFIEAYKKNDLKFRESGDSFANDTDGSLGQPGLVGDDFVPMLGGPFNKQQYFYDYLRGHTQSFFAATHDPIAKRLVSLTRQFVLGKGFRISVICQDEAKKELATAIIRAHEEINDLQQFARYVCDELSIYGETMVWKLPNNATKIGYQLRPGQEVPTGLLPRFRLIDPSAIWEVVTYPEDITRVLYYQWVAPTQYQLYTGSDAGQSVPTLKFIVQQVPGDQVRHYKINVVSNEKRGRGDLYPVLGYLKRLRDSVNYSIVGMQKASAWAMDTVIEGDDADLDAYVRDQQALSTIAPAGSEFVHTNKVKREYLSNQHASHGSSQAFDWCLSMICAGYGVPVSYLGTHQSGGQTRASALVGTEPVAKMMEERQVIVGNILRDSCRDVLKQCGIEADVEVIFPEIITQDRSAKLKDLALAEQLQWLSKSRAATMAAKEFNIDEFEYDAEQQDIANDGIGDSGAPAATPGAGPLTKPAAVPADKTNKPSGVSSEEKKSVKMNMGFLGG